MHDPSLRATQFRRRGRRGAGTATLALAATILTVTAAHANAPTSFPLQPQPPGKIAQSVTVYLQGEAMNSRFLAVASRVRLAAAAGGRPAAFQPYLTVYRQMRGDRFLRVYRSPGPGDQLKLVPTVRRYGPMYFPVTTLRLDPAGELMAPGRQQLIVSTHETGADCGSATVHVLTYDPGQRRIADAVRVTNPCDLSATPVGGALLLRGPYYNKDAPLCCPTKPRAHALLRYAKGRWTERPAYFKLLPSAKTLVSTGPSHRPMLPREPGGR